MKNGTCRTPPRLCDSNITINALDPDTFAGDSRAVIDFLAGYYGDVERYPVQSEAEAGSLRRVLPDAAPETGEAIDGILEDVGQHILPGLTHFQSPNFFAYYPANASTAGFVGEMLCAGLNVVPFTWAASPMATELECLMLDWMGKLMCLPDRFLFSGSGGGGGVLHGSTCESVVCTLAAARDRALKRLMTHEAILKLVVYASDQSHTTFQKGARIVGIPPSNFRVIPTSAASSYGLTAESVRDAVEADLASGLVPLYLCATVGTTGVGAVDPVGELGEVARRYGMWLHVDAAYAGSALICPEFQGYMEGAELADSVSMNPHKWFLTNMDCCCLWVATPSQLTSEYLNDVSSCDAEGRRWWTTRTGRLPWHADSAPSSCGSFSGGTARRAYGRTSGGMWRWPSGWSRCSRPTSGSRWWRRGDSRWCASASDHDHDHDHDHAQVAMEMAKCKLLKASILLRWWTP
uniref:Aromatic-L-amino-acid decarboxylase n=1 Tax=Hordeum vulgare subsp. vulgare TaxID=112509 RepID=A0A8I6XIU2_HORVV